jgi:hypothetical protein
MATVSAGMAHAHKNKRERSTVRRAHGYSDYELHPDDTGTNGRADLRTAHADDTDTNSTHGQEHHGKRGDGNAKNNEDRATTAARRVDEKNHPGVLRRF